MSVKIQPKLQDFLLTKTIFFVLKLDGNMEWKKVIKILLHKKMLLLVFMAKNHNFILCMMIKLINMKFFKTKQQKH